MENTKPSKRTLVTGGTGFIGAHFVKQMRMEGRPVRVLARKTSDLACLEGLGVEVVYGDILDPNSLAETCKDVDYVVHLAAQVDRPGIRKEQYELTNFRGTMNLVDEATANKVEKFIFVSSVAAMGIRNIGKVSEKDSCRPNTDYGKSKRRIEEALITKHSETGFPVIIIRPPTVFGEGERYNFLTLCRQIKNGPFFLIGKGDNKMDFCQVENLVKGIISSLDKGKPGEVYLITDDRPYTIQEVSEAIAKLLGAKISRFHIPRWIAYLAAYIIAGIGGILSFNPPLYPSRVTTLSGFFFFDITKARLELDYKPGGDFVQRVKRTIGWYHSNGLI